MQCCQGWTLNNTWSSTSNGAGGHYYVYLNNGYVDWDYDTLNGFVTCVR